MMEDSWTLLRWHWAECAKTDPDYRTPDESRILAEMFDRYEQLRKLGWQDAIYCPKDGSVFLCIEAGSTGVHPCSYTGEWPNGHWFIYSAGDAWPSHPILWKPLTELVDANPTQITPPPPTSPEIAARPLAPGENAERVAS